MIYKAHDFKDDTVQSYTWYQDENFEWNMAIVQRLSGQTEFSKYKLIATEDRSREQWFGDLEKQSGVTNFIYSFSASDIDANKDFTAIGCRTCDNNKGYVYVVDTVTGKEIYKKRGSTSTEG